MGESDEVADMSLYVLCQWRPWLHIYSEKWHTDRVLLWSVCELLDQVCVCFESSESLDLRKAHRLCASPGWLHQSGLKKHMDRVLLWSVCEPLDQGCVWFEACESLDQQEEAHDPCASYILHVDPSYSPMVHLIWRHSRATVGLYDGETVCSVISTKYFSSSTKYHSHIVKT